MSPARLSWLVCLASLGGATALAQPPAPGAAAAPAAKRTPAEELLDRSLDKLAKLPWMETTFRHLVHGNGMPYQAEGKHILVPADRRVCYESRVKLGNSHGLVRIQCDGETVWRVLQNGADKHIQKYTLKELDDARQKIERKDLGPERSEQLLRDDASEHGFLGVQPALLELKEKLTFPKMSSGVLPGDVPVYVLEGEWSKAYLDKLTPAKKEGSTGPDLRESWAKRTGFLRFPRSCKLYLGRDNLWPYRIEWFGPVVAEGPDERLVAMEWNDPKLEKPSSADVAKLFQPTEEERKDAENLDASVLIMNRQRNLLNAKAQEERNTLDKPLLDPTLIPKQP